MNNNDTKRLAILAQKILTEDIVDEFKKHGWTQSDDGALNMGVDDKSGDYEEEDKYSAYQMSDDDYYQDMVETKLNVALKYVEAGDWKQAKNMVEIALDHLDDAISGPESSADEDRVPLEKAFNLNGEDEEDEDSFNDIDDIYTDGRYDHKMSKRERNRLLKQIK